jgi:hypothetical protein
VPYCTNCGHKNPDDARFCSQCGTRLEAPVVADETPTSMTPAVGATPVAPGEPVGESTATIQLGGSGEAAKVETGDRALNPVDAAAVDALPTGHALLVVQRGPGSGSRFLLDEDVVHAGRHPDSGIFLDDVTVSRRHAEFHRNGDTFTVTDVGSLNGTYVNRDRIDTVQLTDSDEVQIGKYRLVFFSGHEGR